MNNGNVNIDIDYFSNFRDQCNLILFKYSIICSNGINNHNVINLLYEIQKLEYLLSQSEDYIMFECEDND